MRVVSLLASGTEIVCALGAGESLVGRSHECDRPRWVSRLPACTRPTFDVTLTSGEIDAEVKRQIAAGEPLYDIDAVRIDELNAGVLIAQVHCDVCAVTPDDARQAGADAGRTIVALQAGDIEGIYGDIRAVGKALNLEPQADAVVAGIAAQIESVRRATAALAPAKPTVLVLEWTDPMFAAGNWMPALVDAANATPAIGGSATHSTVTTWQDVRRADPDHLIIAPCGFDLARTLREVRYLESLPGWHDLRAVREGNVALADGNAYFNRSGTTIGDTAEILAEIIHGVGNDHYQNAWVRLGDKSAEATIADLHSSASRDGDPTYVDPATGYDVLTADFLRNRGRCCGSGCRHCPYLRKSASVIHSLKDA